MKRIVHRVLVLLIVAQSAFQGAMAERAISMPVSQIKGININPSFNARRLVHVEGPQTNENYRTPVSGNPSRGDINISGEEMTADAINSYVGRQSKVIRVTVANNRRDDMLGDYFNRNYMQSLLRMTDKKIMVSDYSKGHMGQLDGSGLIRSAKKWARLKRFLNANKKRLYLNIVNEPTRGGVSEAKWRDGNIQAIKILRDAGVQNTLVLTANGWGQSAKGILWYGKEIASHDVRNDVIFSIHAYHHTWKNEKIIRDDFKRLKKTGLRIIIGEYGPRYPIDSRGANSALVNAIAREAIANGFGYLAWAWGPNASNHWSTNMDIAKYDNSRAEETYYYDDGSVRKYLLPRPLSFEITPWGNMANWHLQGMP